MLLHFLHDGQELQPMTSLVEGNARPDFGWIQAAIISTAAIILRWFYEQDYFI